MISLAAGAVVDIGPGDAVGVAGAAGFDAVGIWFDPATWTDTVADDVRRRADDRGLVVLDIEPIMLTPAGSQSPDHGEAIIDAALRIGARNVLVASRDTDANRVADRLGALAERLDGSDIRLVLEFLPVLGVRTMTQALDIVAAAGDARLGVLIDSLHLARAGHHPADLVGLDPHLFPYLQLCDAPAQPTDADIPTLLHEALHGRLPPGEGQLPLRPLLAAVSDVPISLEVRSQPLLDTYPNPVDRARLLHNAMTALLADGS